MQAFSVAFGRVSRATFSADPELRTHIISLVERAYFNIHASPLASADSSWASSITAAAMQLCMDHRVRQLQTRELVHLFENVIRVSEEHLHEAKRHAAMASNVFYLKETALDAAVLEHQQPPALHDAETTVLAFNVAHARMRNPKDSDA